MSNRFGHGELLVALATVALVLLVAGQSVAAAGVGIENVTFSGENVFTANGQTYVPAWDGGNVSVTLSTGSDRYEVCISTVAGNRSPTSIGCQVVAGNDAKKTVDFPVQNWSAPGPTSQRLRVVVSAANGGNGALAQTERPYELLPPNSDFDGDGLSNRAEDRRGTGLRKPDSDGDGLSDGQEVQTYDTNPMKPDTDGDGLGDGVEVNTHRTNPTKADTDGDGLPDGKEVSSHGTDPVVADTDEDGLPDGVEVNQRNTNPTNPDTDNDGLQDGAEVNVHETDPTVPDTDGDGLTDAAEVNEYDTNPSKADTDGDGLADGPEVNVHNTDPNDADTDGDGAKDGAEVANGTNPGSVGGPLESSDVDPTTLVVVVLAIGLTVAGAVLWRRYQGDGRPGESAPGSDDLPPPSDQPETAATPTDADSPAVDEADDRVDRLLTDEARIQELLQEHGGQLKQAQIVELTPWSKSKVSRLISTMAEENKVTKITLGRENLITLPGEEPEQAGSPFEE